MKQLNIFTLLAFLFCAFPLVAQEEETVVVVTDSAVETDTLTAQEYFDNKYYGMNQNYVDFTSDQKKFDDWSLAVYGGINLIQGSDLNTWISNDDYSML